MQNVKQHTQGKIFSVSRLTSEIKALLEERYPFIWINGEISNLARPSSGHIYFTLKDDKSQISAVMFRNQCRNLRFSPENGLNITGLGRLSLYEPRGTYQIIFEFIEPKGAGALQLAFEQLKNRLAKEGLFDERFKKTIPFLPKRISIITSPTGAVIHDIKNIVTRRFSDVILEVVPVKVQGTESENEIVAGLNMLNQRGMSDVIIIARGGGSIEDFTSFNSEKVARAVFSSKIPVISAVGHETDYTITDFVSDLRAPTPSAAAELVVPEKRELYLRVNKLGLQLKTHIDNIIKGHKSYLENLSKRIIHPKRKVQDMRLLTEDYTQRLIRLAKRTIVRNRESLNWKKEKLTLFSPLQRTYELKNNLTRIDENLSLSMSGIINSNRSKLNELSGRLNALSPASIFERGYSITRAVPGMKIITDSESVQSGDNVEVILAKGSIACSVKGIIPNGKKNI